jgi:hypothetical protein
MTRLEKKLMAEIEGLKVRIAALEARPMITITPNLPAYKSPWSPWMPAVWPAVWPPITYPNTTCGSPAYLDVQTVRNGEVTTQSFQNAQ